MSEMKYFTPEEANQRLPLIKKIVEDILGIGDKIRARSAEIGTNAQDDPQIIRLMDDLDALFEELESLGCFYKDWNFTAGLVDFPAIFNDEEVFLCWRSDEKEVRFYHEIDAGFAGRKPIPEDYLSKLRSA